jgi:single-stranded-DNA-specific exonuclease
MQFSIEKKWKVAPIVPDNIKESFTGFSDVMVQLLFNRGFKDAQSAVDYLNGTSPLSDPFLLKDMEKAVETILYSIDNHEKIVVFGDYDVDGITATAILTQVLSEIGADVTPYIPDRFIDGYGVNINALDNLFAKATNLIITVDCGIRSPNELYYAKNNLGMKVVVSDHHMPEEQLPEVDAIICQKQPGDQYPDKNLSGAGLAYKIAEALLLSRPFPNLDIKDWLDLAALGTVADVVPLTGENRVIVRQGVNRMRMCKRVGLISLMQVAGIKISNVTAMDISFGIAPRLNAAGRILSNHEAVKNTTPDSISNNPIDTSFDIPLSEDPYPILANSEDQVNQTVAQIFVEKHRETQKALNILITSDKNVAGLLAQELDDLNRKRQKLTHEMQKLAETQINPDDLLLHARHEEFNSGLVGLVAAKLTEFYYRPTIIGYKGKSNTRASCRSIPEFHITNALDLCSDLLLQHGGHAMAAGFTVENEKWDELLEKLTRIAQQELNLENINPYLIADIEIPINKIPKNILIELDRMEPIGAENAPALFISRRLYVYRAKAVGVDEKHLKLTLKDSLNTNETYDGIAFNQGYWLKNLPNMIDIIYQYERNFFNGNIYSQLNIKDIKAS